MKTENNYTDIKYKKRLQSFVSQNYISGKLVKQCYMENFI